MSYKEKRIKITLKINRTDITLNLIVSERLLKNIT
jgi:hypothetical protein